MSTELARTTSVGLLNVETGELLEPTIDNAAAALLAARNMRERINDVTSEITGFAVELASERGTKTLHGEQSTLSLSGGPSEDYDAQDLMELLRSAGCPEDRIEEAVVAHIEFKVNRSVIRQLAAANPDYKAAIDLSRREVEKPYRASAKRKGT